MCVSAFQERETVSVEAPMEIDVDKDLEVIVAGVTSVNLAHGDEEVANVGGASVGGGGFGGGE